MRTIIPIDQKRKHDPSINRDSTRNAWVTQPCGYGERLTRPARSRSNNAAANLHLVGSSQFQDDPQPSNWPRSMMLVLIQLAVGIIVAERILTWVFKNTAPAFDVLNWEDAQFPMAMGTLISAILGIGISGIFRASRPEPRETLHSQKCWPIRERFVSTLFAATVAVYVLLLSQSVDLPITPWSVELCGYAAAAIGVGCIVVSGMVHVAAQREVWSALRVFRQFGWTTVMFGWTAGLVVLNLARLDSTGFRSAPVGLLSCCLLLEAGAILTTARLFGVSWFMPNLERKFAVFPIELSS